MITQPDVDSATLFGLLRHGITEWNSQGRIQGLEDSPLTATGRAQVLNWIDILRLNSWQRILASDLGRVQQTVALLNQSLNLPIVWESGLREQNWGEWEGMTLQQVRSSAGILLEKQITAGWEFTPPGGESRLSVRDRVKRALREAAVKWPEEKILVICHQGVIKCLIYDILGRSFLPDEPDVIQKNCFHMVENAGNTFRPVQLNISSGYNQ